MMRGSRRDGHRIAVLAIPSLVMLAPVVPLANGAGAADCAALPVAAAGVTSTVGAGPPRAAVGPPLAAVTR